MGRMGDGEKGRLILPTYDFRIRTLLLKFKKFLNYEVY